MIKKGNRYFNHIKTQLKSGVLFRYSTFFWENSIGRWGVILLLFFGFMAVASFVPPLIDPMYQPMTGVDPDICNVTPPSFHHWLGTDYMGEDKKGFLRQAMWAADTKGMLGLHAGTKKVTAVGQDGKLKKYGVFLFGLTATGKSTWSCHQLGLDHSKGEKTLVTQDDICFLRKDGSALGSENNFFVKTDVEEKYQEAMYNALIDKSALYENVMIKANGEPDFLDESLTANGRAVIQRKKLQVKIDGKMVDIFSDSINLPPIEEMDGLIFAFITRRNTIMSFAQELTPAQAVLAYLWGESTHSYASQPAKAGETVRIVGTDPFIIGSRAKKVNRLYEILMTLSSNHPDKLKCMQYNTGGMGEVIETYEENGTKKKNK